MSISYTRPTAVPTVGDRVQTDRMREVRSPHSGTVEALVDGQVDVRWETGPRAGTTVRCTIGELSLIDDGGVAACPFAGQHHSHAYVVAVEVPGAAYARHLIFHCSGV